MFRFLFSLLVSTAILTGVVLWAHHEGYFEKPSFFVQTLILLTLTTSVIFIYLFRARGSAYFTQLYLLTMVVKVLAYCAYNLLMVLKDKPSAVENVIFFMVVYFAFTVLEIGFLYSAITGRKGR